MPTPLQSLEATKWNRDGEEFTGTAVAKRLMRLGARKAEPATIEELLAVPVGGAVNTGVSSYVRIA